MSSLEFIKTLASGNSAEAKEQVMETLSRLAFDALDARKQEIAKNLFGEESIKLV